MAIIDIISLFSTSGILGGITGLVGNELKSRREIKMLKLRSEMEQAAWPEREKVRAHEMEMRGGTFEHELKLHDLNRAAKSEENENAIIRDEISFSGNGLLRTIQGDITPDGSPVWVQSVRSLMRPFTLAILLLLTALIYFASPQEGRQIIASAVVYMTSVGVLFYFGDRPSSPMRKMLLSLPDTSARANHIQTPN